MFVVTGKNQWTLSALTQGNGRGEMKVAWAVSDAYRGPLLIRLFIVQNHTMTPVQMSAPIGQASPTELHFDKSSMTDPSLPDGWRLWGSTAELREPGCFVWQIEGQDLRRTATLEVLPG